MHIYADPICIAHEPPEGHPERPERLRALLEYFTASGILADHPLRQPNPVNDTDLLRAHPQVHLDFLQSLDPSSAEHSASPAGPVPVDPDTWLSTHSLAAARLAAGAVCDGIDALVSGETKRVFCAVRPPGHHAEAAAAMGFCLFNSIAVGALAALQKPHIERVAVLDFDVHHGNGTVDICKDNPNVLVCSSFQHPHYPNRMYDIDRPNIINTPLAAGSDGATFRQAVETQWLPALENHQPQLISVSAGFDAHRLDPLADLNLVEDDFAWVTQLIVDAAERYSAGRVLSTLEGGYDLQALVTSVEAHLTVLA